MNEHDKAYPNSAERLTGVLPKNRQNYRIRAIKLTDCAKFTVRQTYPNQHLPLKIPKLPYLKTNVMKKLQFVHERCLMNLLVMAEHKTRDALQAGKQKQRI